MYIKDWRRTQRTSTLDCSIASLLRGHTPQK